MGNLGKQQLQAAAQKDYSSRVQGIIHSRDGTLAVLFFSSFVLNFTFYFVQSKHTTWLIIFNPFTHLVGAGAGLGPNSIAKTEY